MTNKKFEVIIRILLVVMPISILILMTLPLGGQIVGRAQFMFYATLYIYFGSLVIMWLIALINHLKKRTLEIKAYHKIEILIMMTVLLWITFGLITSIYSLVLLKYVFHPVIYYVLSIISSMTLSIISKLTP